MSARRKHGGGGNEHASRPTGWRQIRQLEHDLDKAHPDWSERRLKRAAKRALRAIQNGMDTTGRGNSPGIS